MIRKTWVLCGAVVTFGILAAGCPAGGVGDPCTPEDEYQKYFGSYAASEVNTESKSFQCLTRLCLVNHFQGRVSCPYGQTDEVARGAQSGHRCYIPGTEDPVEVAVLPQLEGRKAKDAVYCSCRCDGSDKNAKYCPCPSGYECAPLVQANSHFSGQQLAGSYCIKQGSAYREEKVGSECTVPSGNENSDPPGNCGSWDGQ